VQNKQTTQQRPTSKDWGGLAATNHSTLLSEVKILTTHLANSLCNQPIGITCTDCASLEGFALCIVFRFTNSWIHAVQVGQLLVNLYINLKLIFMTLALSLNSISMSQTVYLCIFKWLFVLTYLFTYVPFSRPNRRTNLLILHRPPHQLREGS